MIRVRKIEKSYYEQDFTNREIVAMLMETLPGQYKREDLRGMSDAELAAKLSNVIECFEVSEWFDSELSERDSADEWEIEMG